MCRDFAAAVEAFEKRVALCRSHGDPYSEVSAVQFLAEAEHGRGRTQRAIEHVEAALARMRPLVAGEHLLGLLGNLLGYRAALGDADGVRSVAREAIALAARDGATSIVFPIIIQHVALAIALSGDVRVAARLAAYSAAALDAAGFVRWTTEQVTQDRLQAILCERVAAGDLALLSEEGGGLTLDRVLEAVDAEERAYRSRDPHSRHSGDMEHTSTSLL
jgi:hypothetical protein